MRKFLYPFLVIFLLNTVFSYNVQIVTAATCPKKSVQLEETQLFSPEVNTDLRLNIYLPLCYDNEKPGGYPVLYLLHGQSMDLSVWDEIELGEALSQQQQSQPEVPFIVVAPQEDAYLINILESKFGEALVNSVIPWIEESYNVCTQQDCQAIGGISRGALWAEKIAFAQTDFFSSLGLHSLPGTAYSDPGLKSLINKQRKPMRVYMDIGNQDAYRHTNLELSNQLNLFSYCYVRIVNPGEHNVEYWRSQMPNYLSWYAEGFAGIKWLDGFNV